jgi:hypothetical protein
MTTTIELEDLDIQGLSKETLDLVSELAAQISKLDGTSFSFNDPFLLTKLRRHVKRNKNRSLRMLYSRFTTALRHSVSNGQFNIRPYRISVDNRSRFSMRRPTPQMMTV